MYSDLICSGTQSRFIYIKRKRRRSRWIYRVSNLMFTFRSDKDQRKNSPSLYYKGTLKLTLQRLCEQTLQHVARSSHNASFASFSLERFTSLQARYT